MLKNVIIAAAASAALLVVPQQPTEAAGQISSYQTPNSSKEYIVKPGDCLYKIAKQVHCPVKTLIDMNPALKRSNGRYIVPNQKIDLPAAETMTGYEKQVLNLTNNARAQAGLAPLLDNDTALNRSARVKAEDMAHNNYFSHTSPTYGSPFDQMRAMGVIYQAAGENIAKGQKTPQEVVNAWLNSPGHRANIMNKSFTHMGVGYEANAKTWVQQFTSK